MSPTFNICKSKGSRLKIIYNAIWGVVLVILHIKRVACLFREPSFFLIILLLTLGPQIILPYVSFGLITPVYIHFINLGLALVVCLYLFTRFISCPLQASILLLICALQFNLLNSVIPRYLLCFHVLYFSLAFSEIVVFTFSPCM